MKAPVYEIFGSFQGEGIYLGQKQIFIRFGGCNLNCSYCDEPSAKNTTRLLWPEQVISKVKKLKKKESAKTVSLTGGEPLCYVDFLAELLPLLKKLKFTTYLETNATMPSKFKKISQFVDIVSADIKLPSDCGRQMWGLHKKFLAQCKNKVFVKIVLTRQSKFSECAKAVKLISKISPKITLVLQPVTENAKTKKPSSDFIARLVKFSQNSLDDVRVVPQMHPVWKVR
jgi:7-carboxy-7-deazaguanine synthase